MKKNIKRRGFSAFAGLAGTTFTLISVIGFCIYGAVYPEYFDLAVAIFLVVGGAASAIYAFTDQPVAEWLPLTAVFCVSFAMGLFFINSYNVWADWYGNFDMYGSRGGITPVVILLVLYFLAVLCDITACFTRKRMEVYVP